MKQYFIFFVTKNNVKQEFFTETMEEAMEIAKKNFKKATVNIQELNSSSCEYEHKYIATNYFNSMVLL